MVVEKVGSEREGEVDRVYRVLKAWILEARLRPGDFLSEVDLARQCETSRTPIREACNLLSKEKWIQRIRHKGYVIPPISIREIVEVYEYRKLLECFCAERAAATATPDEVKVLREIIADSGVATNRAPTPSLQDRHTLKANAARKIVTKFPQSHADRADP